MKYLITISLTINIIFGYFLFNLNNKIEKTRSLSVVALYGSFCNNYKNRALEHFVRHKNWEGYVMFSPVCDLQNALEVRDAIKYRGLKPKGDFIFHTYDSYYTGKGHNGHKVDKMHEKNFEKVYKEIREIIEQ